MNLRTRLRMNLRMRFSHDMAQIMFFQLVLVFVIDTNKTLFHFQLSSSLLHQRTGP